jgi:hypothetical protein
MLASYLPVRSAGFVYEDHDAAPMRSADPERPAIRGPWQGWDVERIQFNHHPRVLTNLTMRLQVWAGASAAGFHAFNVGIHLVNGLLLASLLLPFGESVALLAVLLFWLHPLNGEAVRYVSARTDLLLVCAVLLTLRLTTKATWPRVLLVTVCGALAPWAKESGVIIIGLLPLWLWFSERWDRRWLMPLACWASAGLWITYRLVHVTGPNAPAWSAIAQYTAPAAHAWSGFVAVQCAALWRLISLIVVPIGFSIDHDFDAVPLWLGAVALVALLVAIASIWRWRVARFAALWLLTWLSVRFVIPQPEFVHEQHLYGACLGVWLALACGLTSYTAPRSLAAWAEESV